MSPGTARRAPRPRRTVSPAPVVTGRGHGMRGMAREGPYFPLFSGGLIGAVARDWGEVAEA